MKGVAKDYERDAAAGCKLSGRSTHRAGTKRRRVIRSGADEMLELESAAEDETEERGLVNSTYHRQPRLQHVKEESWHGRWYGFSVDCQAMGVGTPNFDHAFPCICPYRPETRLLPAHPTTHKGKATRLWVTTTTIPQKA